MDRLRIEIACRELHEVPDPREECNLDRPCGRGVFIIRHFMTTVDYRGRGNVIVMSKLRTPDE